LASRVGHGTGTYGERMWNGVEVECLDWVKGVDKWHQKEDKREI